MQFLIDVTGTLLLPGGKAACPGARDFLDLLERRQVPYLILSNHSTGAPDDLLEKLMAADLPARRDLVLTSAEVAADGLASQQRGSCLVLGRPELVRYLRRRGVRVTTPGARGLPRSGWAVVVGFSENLTWAHLKRATEWLLGGARLFALHAYRAYKDGDGWRGPGVGAMTRCLEYAAACEAFVFGKPSPAFYERAVARLPFGAASTVLVSDDAEGDLAAGQRLGMRTVFVETGKYGRAEVAGGRMGWREDMICPTIGGCASLVQGGADPARP